MLTTKKTLFIIQDIRHVHHLAPTLFVLHLHTDETLILLPLVAVSILILQYFTPLIRPSCSNPLSENLFIVHGVKSAMLTH